MYAYCAGELRLSDEAAFKRIHAGRTARRFPEIFRALAAGRLHLSAVILLAPHLDEANAAELLAAASDKTKSEIERLLAERFPRLELATGLVPIEAAENSGVASPVGNDQHAPGRVDRASLPPVTAVAPQRFTYQVVIDEETREKLERAEALLSHTIPSREPGLVLSRVLDLALGLLEKRKFAATENPRRPKESQAVRCIPAHVRRAVWARDGGQCTFTSEAGHRCSERSMLEYDHVQPVACGGTSTVDGIRLRCRAHNQYEAERSFGPQFMEMKRGEAIRQRREAAQRKAEEIIPWLRQLGVRMDRARWVAGLCVEMSDASLEERVKAALRHLSPRNTTRMPAPATVSA